MASQLPSHPSPPPHGRREQPSAPLTGEERRGSEAPTSTPTFHYQVAGCRPLGKRDESPSPPLMSAALLADVLETIPEAVIGVNHKGQVFYWNRGAEALFGWTAEEIQGRKLDRLHIYAGYTGSHRYLSRGGWKPPEKETEWRCISKSGQRLSLKVKVLPIPAEHRPEPDGPPEPGGWLIIGQDMTEAWRAERRAAQLVVINAVMRRISTTHDLNAIAQTVVEALYERLGFSQVTVMWLDRDAQELVLAAHRAPSDPVPAGYRQKITTGVVGRAVRSGQAQLVRDTRRDPDYVAPYRPRRSELCVPIQHEGEVWGVINLEDDKPDAFDENDVESVQTIADGLALALESVRLLEEERRARVQAETLRELAEVVSTSLDLRDVLQVVVSTAAAALGVNRSVILVVDAKRRVLTLGASVGPSGTEHLRALWEQMAASTADEALLGRFIRGEVVAYADALADSLTRPYAEAFHIRSLLVAPLLSKGHFLGLLTFDQVGEQRYFSPEDVSLARAVAHQAAIAVRNAQLYADAQAKAERLAVINALDRAIYQGSLDLRQLFETFTAQAGRLVPYDRMSLALLEGDQYHLLAVEPGLSPGIGREHWLPRQGTSFEWAIEHNQTLVRADITQPPHFSTDALLIPAGIRSTVVVPLVARGRALGTWNMARCQPNAFAPEEIAIFETVAGQLAIALDNVRLHQDLAEQAARLRQAYSQLEQADQLKDEMIQNISHELRMPLTIVRGYLELILDGALGEVPPGLEEALRTASRRTDEIVEIVERITTLHGLRLGGLEMERLSLSTLVQQAADIAQRAAQNAGLTLQVALPDDALYVQGNAERLLQVLDSLLDNAIKFNRPGGHILVTAREENGLVAVEVTDTGIGIPADKLDQVWAPFYQVDGSTTRRYGGMGVGLALVKEVIEAHGGAVWARSAEGQGSTFGFGLRRSL